MDIVKSPYQLPVVCSCPALHQRTGDPSTSAVDYYIILFLKKPRTSSCFSFSVGDLHFLTLFLVFHLRDPVQSNDGISQLVMAIVSVADDIPYSYSIHLWVVTTIYCFALVSWIPLNIPALSIPKSLFLYFWCGPVAC